MHWFYANAGNREGPVDEAALRRLYGEGVVTSTTLVWNPDLPDWQPFATVAPTVVPDAPPVPVAPWCVECGQARPASDLLYFGQTAVCGACKPVFLRRLKQGTFPESGRAFAGFWVRAAAKLVDTVILVALLSTISEILSRIGPANAAPAFLLGVGFNVLVSLLFATFFLGRFGATPGKMACGLTVIEAGGAPLSYRRALARSAAEYLSAFTLNLGYLMAAFDSQRRALHDHLCDTRVVRNGEW